MSIRVGFTVIGGRSWLGGYNYLLNLLRVLQVHSADEVTPVLCAGTDVPSDDLKPFSFLEEAPVVHPVFNRAVGAGRIAERMLLGSDREAERVFRSNGIHAVFEPAIYYGWRFSLPAIAWIPDFQHRLMPGMFSRGAWWKRELGLRMQMLSGRTLMLSSRAAAEDLKRFYGISGKHVFVVPFAVGVPKLAIEPESVRAKYGLPADYFHLPNQFWKHKNHSVVIEALGLLKGRGSAPVIAVTGNPEDPRHPGHFESLMGRCKELGISDHFRHLGIVPYADLLALMKGARAVINPSRLEGWSTTVEEAKSLGIPLVLSSIPVHLEQAPDAAFFDPTSPEELATALGREFPGASSSERVQSADGAAEAAKLRLREFARSFVRVAEHAVGKSR